MQLLSMFAYFKTERGSTKTLKHCVCENRPKTFQQETSPTNSWNHWHHLMLFLHLFFSRFEKLCFETFAAMSSLRNFLNEMHVFDKWDKLTTCYNSFYHLLILTCRFWSHYDCFSKLDRFPLHWLTLPLNVKNYVASILLFQSIHGEWV